MIRNTTTDHFAGVAPDEIVDPLVWCEIVRQWSAFHPEFAYLPRKFKIAVSGGESDRAATQVHDIGLQARRDAAGQVGFRVRAGGGLGVKTILGGEFEPGLVSLAQRLRSGDAGDVQTEPIINLAKNEFLTAPACRRCSATPI